MSLKHLSEGRNLKDFFSKLKKLDLINFEQIRELGRKHGWLIEYCDSYTSYYTKYGKYICKVIAKMSANQKTFAPIKEATIATKFDKSWVKKKALAEFIK